MEQKKNKAGRQKATTLKVWQKEITRQDWEKAVLSGDRSVGQNTSLGKYYRTDMTNPDYVKYIAEKKARKSAKMKKARANGFKLGYNKGKREGVKEFKTSDRLKKLLEIAFKKGARSTKPVQSIADRIAKKKQKLAELSKSLEELEKKTGAKK